MITELRRQFATYLTAHCTGVLCLGDSLAGTWAMPVRYTNRDLTIACLLPSWAEITFRLESSATITLIVPSNDDRDAYWLTYRGTAKLGALADWHELWPSPDATPTTAELYEVIEITPRRLDLIDQRQGWGHRINLDCEG